VRACVPPPTHPTNPPPLAHIRVVLAAACGRTDGRMRHFLEGGFRGTCVFANAFVCILYHEMSLAFSQCVVACRWLDAVDTPNISVMCHRCACQAQLRQHPSLHPLLRLLYSCLSKSDSNIDTCQIRH